MDNWFQPYDEWKSLLGRTQSYLARFNLPDLQDDFSELYLSLGELDTYHRHFENHFKLVLEEKGSVESSSRLFGDFFVQAPIGYLILSGDGIIEDANCAASEYWSIDRHKLKGLGLFGLIAGDYISRLTRALDAAKHTGQRVSVDVKCTKPGGIHFWGRFDIILAEDRFSGSRRLLCSIVDITADRILEDAIKKTAVGLSSVTGSDFFKQLTEFLTGYPQIDIALISEITDRGEFVCIATSPSKIIPFGFRYPASEDKEASASKADLYEPNMKHIKTLKDNLGAQDGSSMYLFDANRKISGHLAILTKGQFDNKKLYNSILKVVSARASAELQRYRAEEALKAYRDSLEDLIDKRTNELKIKNQKLANEVEKRKATEKRLREAKSQAEEATNAKSVFLANMSHEIRTPMNGILGVAAIMERLPITGKILEYIQMIKMSGDALLHIINDILDISKLESGKIDIDSKAFNLRELLYNLCDVHLPTARAKGIHLFVDYPLNYPQEIVSDPVRLRQILENLLSNALKFTDKGFVLIKVHAISGRPDGINLKISIRDTGIGLSNEETKIIFERFSQADSSTTRKYGGTGLGLPICRKIAHLFGGEVYCKSKPGEGSIFYFTLPIKLKDYLHSRRLSRPKSKTSVALVLKDQKFQAVLEPILESVGFKVFENLNLKSPKDKRPAYLITDCISAAGSALGKFPISGEFLFLGRVKIGSQLSKVIRSF